MKFDLRAFRKRYNIKQTELAGKLGIGQPFISQIESGKDPMPEQLLNKLIELYGADKCNEFISDISAMSNTVSGDELIEEMLKSDDRQSGADYVVPNFGEEPINTDEMIKLLNRAFDAIAEERALANRIQDECERRGADNRELIQVIKQLTGESYSPIAQKKGA